ncbi:hypothetical protein Y032_0022g613 [Ancylostoma ceylanicum]|uniref:Secreted protein n=1 Tax=Ancylostoma ceylanicum TaxID=53326 RepID=A0A016UYC3_9BILA|nr:hypothetical protein Y032_0022g613 [Ancylostoma ceylanicum]
MAESPAPLNITLLWICRLATARNRDVTTPIWDLEMVACSICVAVTASVCQLVSVESLTVIISMVTLRTARWATL